MKVLLINGSPDGEGNTALALKEMRQVFATAGVDSELVTVGQLTVPGCRACGACRELGRCVEDDIVNALADKLRESDGLVIGSPVYYASANGTLISILDRLFYSSRFDKRMKVGAAVACARRGGITATFDELNKYFLISGMPVAAGQYWNGIHGSEPGEAADDAEGLQQMRTLAQNMVFLMKSIALGRDAYGLPEKEPGVYTNFIR